jgi:hypothetical protein
MSRATLILRSQADRQLATKWVKDVPRGTQVEFREMKRTLPQNSALWAALTDVARQVEWYGQKLTPTDWKDIFTAALVKARIVPNIDGNGFVQLGLHTSDMSKDELSNLLELVYHFGAEHGVVFQEKEVGSEGSPPTSDKEARTNAPVLHPTQHTKDIT